MFYIHWETHLFSQVTSFGGCGSQIYVGRFTLIFNSDLGEKPHRSSLAGMADI